MLGPPRARPALRESTRCGNPRLLATRVWQSVSCATPTSLPGLRRRQMVQPMMCPRASALLASSHLALIHSASATRALPAHQRLQDPPLQLPARSARLVSSHPLESGRMQATIVNHRTAAPSSRGATHLQAISMLRLMGTGNTVLNAQVATSPTIALDGASCFR